MKVSGGRAGAGGSEGVRGFPLLIGGAVTWACRDRSEGKSRSCIAGILVLFGCCWSRKHSPISTTCLEWRPSDVITSSKGLFSSSP